MNNFLGTGLAKMSANDMIFVSKYQGKYHVWYDSASNDYEKPDFSNSKYNSFDNRADALLYAHDWDNKEHTEYGVQEEDWDTRKEASYFKFRIPEISMELKSGDLLVIDPNFVCSDDGFSITEKKLIRIERNGIVIYCAEDYHDPI